jgi:hypothetical protein
VIDGATAAIVEVYLDQTGKQALFHEQFALAAVSLAMMAALSFGEGGRGFGKARSAGASGIEAPTPAVSACAFNTPTPAGPCSRSQESCSRPLATAANEI